MPGRRPPAARGDPPRGARRRRRPPARPARRSDADRTSGPAEHRPRHPTRWTWTSAGVTRRSCRRSWSAPRARQLAASHTCTALGAVTTPPAERPRPAPVTRPTATPSSTMTGARLHRPGHRTVTSGESPVGCRRTHGGSQMVLHRGQDRLAAADVTGRPGAHLAHVPAVGPESEMRVEGGDAVDRGQRHPERCSDPLQCIDREMTERLLHGVQHFDQALGTVAELAHPDLDRPPPLTVGCCRRCDEHLQSSGLGGPASKRPGSPTRADGRGFVLTSETSKTRFPD